MAKLRIKDIENEVKDLVFEDALNKLNHYKDNQGLKIDKLIEKYTKKKIKFEKEVARFNEMTIYEEVSYNKGFSFIAGIDEVGRGPLAGPVVACAVVLPKDVFIEGLNDSKKLSAKKRDLIYVEILEKAITFGLGLVDEQRIDEINILNATKEAMVMALNNLSLKPDMILIDAENINYENIPQKAIIKGDTLSISIAAASVVAKVTRDRLMIDYDSRYPEYEFKSNKGYGTKVHTNAIKNFGLCPIHRVSFTKNFV